MQSPSRSPVPSSASIEASPYEEKSRWPWTLAGAAIGLVDFLVLLFFDANLSVAGRDLTIPMLLLFLIPYGALGWAVGGLILARKRADQDRQTIEAQLVALEKTQRALVQEEKLAGIGRLAAGVAHEVRNPLGVIRASASMAQESFDAGSDPHRALGFICEETDRLDRLIHALLTFAKPQPIERVPTDLTKAIDQATHLAEPEAQRRGVAINVAINEATPPVHADPDRLSQAIYGLLLNAIQAFELQDEAAAENPQDPQNPERSVEILCESTTDAACIRVRDTGPGIPPALRDQIFEPFVTTKASGTGLGLPMALRLIEAQGGAIALEAPSTSSKSGASFRIDLPLYSAPRGRAA